MVETQESQCDINFLAKNKHVMTQQVGSSRCGLSQIDVQRSAGHIVCTPLGGKTKPAAWLAKSRTEAYLIPNYLPLDCA